MSLTFTHKVAAYGDCFGVCSSSTTIKNSRCSKASPTMSLSSQTIRLKVQ